ncbi:MAG: glycoside hydrolase family 28 protein [Bryobacteraceae bacterium]|nr:glycoside hydrolase family 28 protein [Bryobacteraceae bacterium]
MAPRPQLLNRRLFLGALPAAALAAPAEPFLTPARFDAKADGRTLDTKALQTAIDTCARSGGGTVLLPAGRYLTGTLFLRSRVTLHLTAGAVLLGSASLADYPVTVAKLRSYTDNYTDKSLLYGEDLEDVAIEGTGVIDGQGKAFSGPYKVRPYTLRLVNCRRVKVHDIAFLDSPMWVQHYLACDDLVIRGITVRSRANANNDGIDIDACSRVRIAECDIDSGDDALVLKSTLARPCRQIAVTNCVLSSHCNAFKLGTESNGGFEDILFSNSAIHDTRLSGIALECVDGGRLERVQVAGISMNGVGAPLFIRLGHRGRPFLTGSERQPPGTLRNVIIRDIQATRASAIGCALSGLPGHPIEQVTLENLNLEFEGGGKPAHPPGAVPELPDKYPEHWMFGALPAYGLFCRHIRGLTLRGVWLTTARPDDRPPLVVDDVEGLDGSVNTR